ncbi:hypothetical protein WME93_38835 [Sorangium sp. So ce1000]
MHIIMGIPPHIIIMGMPADIIFVMASQRSFSMSIDMPSGGIILQTIPSLVISHDILHIIGIPMPIVPIMDIIGMPMPIMLGIMPIMGIIGVPMPIMPGIIGILMPIMPGIMPVMGIMGMPMPIMPGIMDAPAAISGVAIMGDIVCGIMGICIAVVMGGSCRQRSLLSGAVLAGRRLVATR